MHKHVSPHKPTNDISSLDCNLQGLQFSYFLEDNLIHLSFENISLGLITCHALY